MAHQPGALQSPRHLPGSGVLECFGPVPGESARREALSPQTWVGARGTERRKAAPGALSAGRPRGPARSPDLPYWGRISPGLQSSSVTKGKRPLVTTGPDNTEGKTNPGAAPAPQAGSLLLGTMTR